MQAKIEKVSTKKLNDVISSQKQFSDKSGLGYTGGSSSSGSVTKEVKFIRAKKQIEVSSTTEKPKMEEKRNVYDKRMLKRMRMQPVFKRIIILFLKNQKSMHMWLRRL